MLVLKIRRIFTTYGRKTQDCASVLRKREFVKLFLVLCAIFICTVLTIINFNREVTHVTFLKVHKTASSTAQNIFLRFGDHRNLTFMLASVKHNECENNPNCISFYNSITDKNIIPAPDKQKYDILCSHVIYNRERFHKYLPSDTKYISLVREPVSRLASAMVHFKLFQRFNFSQYASDPIKYDHVRLNNAMAYEFGFRKELFPRPTHRRLSNDEIEEVNLYIKQLFKDFTLIMVNERLDESLVLLKRLLNWKTQDILIKNQVVQNYTSFSEVERHKLKPYLPLDYALYNMAVHELDLKIAQSGPGFMDEVLEFREMNKIVSEYCELQNYAAYALLISASRWHPEFKVKKEFCDDFSLTEIPYFMKIREKQYGTFHTD